MNIGDRITYPRVPRTMNTVGGWWRTADVRDLPNDFNQGTVIRTYPNQPKILRVRWDRGGYGIIPTANAQLLTDG